MTGDRHRRRGVRRGCERILGDVTAVDEDGVTVVWRKTRTVEQPEELNPDNAAFDAAFLKWAEGIGLPEDATGT